MLAVTFFLPGDINTFKKGQYPTQIKYQYFENTKTSSILQQFFDPLGGGMVMAIFELF